MNVTIKNIDKSIGYHVCSDWYVKNAQVIAGYYLWDIEDIRTKEVRRVILNRKVEHNGRLGFIHLGEYAHIKSGISRTMLGHMTSTMHKLADELWCAERISKYN